MDKDFKSLENIWKENKGNIHYSKDSLESIYEKAKEIKQQNFQFYYGNIIILSVALISILSFFYFVAPVQRIMSRLGVSIMVLGLLFRIIIEVISKFKYKKINIYDSTLDAIQETITFHKYRNKVHKTLMPIIIIFYSIGFYIITPEFLTYLSLMTVISYDVLYLIFMAFLVIVIRRGIRKEMKNLELTIELERNVSNE